MSGAPLVVGVIAASKIERYFGATKELHSKDTSSSVKIREAQLWVGLLGLQEPQMQEPC
jgi:hypothetical protein